MPDHLTRFRGLTAACDATVFWHPVETPGAALRRLADLADELDVSWDQYGARGPVAMLEEQLEALFGKPAAFFPSGVMAQQSALRVWCDRSGTSRVAMPDLSHLLVHEQDGPRRLHGFQVEHLTTGAEVATAEALHGVVGRLGAALVELPLRDAGCLLPTWQELTDLSAAARHRGVPLHVDGARIWESQPFWGTSLAEIAALSDSMYVSFYKGLRGIAGAALIGSEDFLAEARVWRTRMGGTLYRSTPEALAALLGLRELLPRMGECLAWARTLAAELPALGIIANPAQPHTPTFLLHADGTDDAVNERLLGVMERERLRMTGLWRASREPGRVMTEVAVSTPALDHEPQRIAQLLAEVAVG
ncbi:threonine aldolase family protein [Nocardioides sp.]|uniref:threonine aldolase family protein n=1 Tax=Nocardioides sp. TaxID=35761 RepID=UPI002CA2388B|nr:beta-eliminating lyase-related protein [Nocardioides sp.]HXH78536.1 beta-eliminating lyase-related protein [Nocardioides sp.]